MTFNPVLVTHGLFTDYSDRFPVETAFCERGNSCLARNMTGWRASVIADTLEALLHISVDGCWFQEYDAARAVQQ